MFAFCRLGLLKHNQTPQLITYSSPTDTRYCSISRTMSRLVRSSRRFSFFGMTARAPVAVGATGPLLLATPLAGSLLPFCALAVWPFVSLGDGSSVRMGKY